MRKFWLKVGNKSDTIKQRKFIFTLYGKSGNEFWECLSHGCDADFDQDHLIVIIKKSRPKPDGLPLHFYNFIAVSMRGGAFLEACSSSLGGSR